MNEICNNYNFPNTLKIGSLIYAISYSKQFGFSNYNINCVIDYFDNLFVMNMDVRNRDSNLILYTGISYHQSN